MPSLTAQFLLQFFIFSVNFSSGFFAVFLVLSVQFTIGDSSDFNSEEGCILRAVNGNGSYRDSG